MVDGDLSILQPRATISHPREVAIRAMQAVTKAAAATGAARRRVRTRDIRADQAAATAAAAVAAIRARNSTCGSRLQDRVLPAATAATAGALLRVTVAARPAMAVAVMVARARPPAMAA